MCVEVQAAGWGGSGKVQLDLSRVLQASITNGLDVMYKRDQSPPAPESLVLSLDTILLTTPTHP